MEVGRFDAGEETGAGDAGCRGFIGGKGRGGVDVGLDAKEGNGLARGTAGRLVVGSPAFRG